MDVWSPLVFYPGEDEAALKAEFVRLTARHKSNPNFTATDIAKYLFRDLKDPHLRALQAAERWSKDLEVQEQIKQTVVGFAEDGKAKRIALLMSIAENDTVETKDRIHAIRVAAELEGELIKAIDKKVSYPNGKPTQRFLFAIDPDADKPNSEEVEEDED